MQRRLNDVLNGRFNSVEEQLLAMDHLLSDDTFRQMLGGNFIWQQILTEKYQELINVVAQKHFNICSTICLKMDIRNLENVSEDSSPDSQYSRYAAKVIRTEMLNEKNPLTRSIIAERWIAILGRSYELGNTLALSVLAAEFNGGPVGRLHTPVSQPAANFLKAVNELLLAGNNLFPITRLTDLRYDLALPIISDFIGKVVSAKEKLKLNKQGEWQEKYALALAVIEEFKVKDAKLIEALEALQVRAQTRVDATLLSDFNSTWDSMVKKINTNITQLEKIVADPSLRSKLIAFESKLNDINTKYSALSEHHKRVVINFAFFLEKLKQKVTVKKGFTFFVPEMIATEQAGKLEEGFYTLSYNLVPKNKTASDKVEAQKLDEMFAGIIFPQASTEFYAESLSNFLALVKEKLQLSKELISHYADEALAQSGKDSLSINKRLNDIIRYCASDNILSAKEMLRTITELLEYLLKNPDDNAGHYQKSAEHFIKEEQKKKLDALKKEYEVCVKKCKKLKKERDAANDGKSKEELQAQLDAEMKAKQKFEDKLEKFEKTKSIKIHKLTTQLKKMQEIYQSIDTILEALHVRNPEAKASVKISADEKSGRRRSMDFDSILKPTIDLKPETSNAEPQSPKDKKQRRLSMGPSTFEKDSIIELRQALKPLVIPRAKQKGHEASPHSSGSVTPSSASRQITFSNISLASSGATSPVLERNGSYLSSGSSVIGRLGSGRRSEGSSPQLSHRSDFSASSSPAPSPVVEPRRRGSLSSTKNPISDSPDSFFRFVTPQLANLQAENAVPPLTPPLVHPIATADLPIPLPALTPPVRPRAGSLALMRNIGIRDLSTLRGSTDGSSDSKKDSQTPKLN